MSLWTRGRALAGMMQTTMFLRVVQGYTLIVLSTVGCGTVTDTELFPQSNAALVEQLGEACELTAVGTNETVVDDVNPACQPGYCVGQGGQPWTQREQGICTCRCEGPEGTGPLCDCVDGFTCKELIHDFGLGQSHLVGSYCVPKD